MTDDAELDRLKARRLEEMQKNISTKHETKEQRLTVSARETLTNILGYRGLEVLNNAELQYPNEAKIIVEKLAELITSGEISEIDGGKLLALFRSVGLNIRMQTKINVKQDGKLVSFSDKLGSSIRNADET